VSPLEQLAFALFALGHAVRGLRDAAARTPWLVPLAVRLAAIPVLAWAAHPALSWALAPLLSASGRGDVLRYPALYRAFPPLLDPVAALTAALVVPLAAGAATTGFAAAFAERPASAASAWRSAGRRAVALLVASAPVALARAGIPAGIAALAGVRLSPLTRSLLPGAGDVLLFALRAAFLYVTADVMLGRRGGFGAIAGVPRSLARGFVPALGLLALASAPGWALGALAAGPLGAFAARVPETAIAVAVVAACADVLRDAVLCGTAVLVWQGAIGRREDA
jgi:hypothetical protein